MQVHLTSALQTLDQIEGTNSSTQKSELLKTQVDNEVLKELLIRTYDPMKVYFIKKLPRIRPRGSHGLPDKKLWLEFLDLLDSLSSRSVTGNNAARKVKDLFSQLNREEYKWYVKVLRKDLKIGINVKTINASIPGLIPIFGCQLAENFRDGAFPSKVIFQRKIDGKRCLGDTDTGLLYSRRGHIWSDYPHIEEYLRQFPPGFIIDGELFNRDFQTTVMKKDSESQKLYAFTLIPKNDFMKGYSPITESGRLEILREVTRGVIDKNGLGPVRYLSHSRTYDSSLDPIEKWGDTWLNQFLKLGYEGMMIKDASAPYEVKRVRSWQKVKAIKTIDLKVVDVLPGNPGTKYENTCGRLLVVYKDTPVKVCGLSDDRRDQYWNNPSSIIGKTIEIKYQETTVNQSNTTSLRFPRFSRERPDKD